MITSITTCVNYDDYLAITLPLNRSLFQQFYVITTSEDTATQQLCRQYKATPIITDLFYHDGANFNKGKAINQILHQLENGWICHIDADIVVPQCFKDVIISDLDQETIYGCPRLMCPEMSSWENYLQTKSTEGWAKYKAQFFRVGREVYKKYLPIGYMQLFHLSHLVKKPYYPETSNNAGESDVRFSLKWNQHHCLDELTAIHLPILGSSREGINWNGRRSPRLA